MEEQVNKKNEEILINGKRYKFYDIKEPIKVEDIAKFSFENVEFEAEELPYLLQYFGKEQARAMRKFRNAETEYNIWKAKTDKLLRIKKEKKKQKFTEAQLSAEIISNPLYLEHKNKIYQAEENYELLKTIYWTIQMKLNIILEALKQKNYNK